MSTEMDKARELAPIFIEVANMYEFDADYHAVMVPNFKEYWFALLLGAIASRESNFGTLLVNDLGDYGHGHGIMQIDDRSHRVWIQNHDWRDPKTNLEYAADIWVENLGYFDNRSELVNDVTIMEIWAATAAYNCGPGNVRKALMAGRDMDYYTTGKDYSADVRARMVTLKSKGWPK